MSNETPAAIDREMFAPVFSQNWDNARHIKSERISFMNAYSVICAGVLALLQSVQAYVQLQQRMHEALLREHPEWVQPNGECPICEAYESRLAELLGLSSHSEQRSAA